MTWIEIVPAIILCNIIILWNIIINLIDHETYTWFDRERTSMQVIFRIALSHTYSDFETRNANCIIVAASMITEIYTEVFDSSIHVDISSLTLASVEREIVIAHRGCVDKRTLVTTRDVETNVVGWFEGQICIIALCMASQLRVWEHISCRGLRLQATEDSVIAFGTRVYLAQVFQLRSLDIATFGEIGQGTIGYVLTKLCGLQPFIDGHIIGMRHIDTSLRYDIKFVDRALPLLHIGSETESKLGAYTLADGQVANICIVVAHLKVARYADIGVIGLGGYDVDNASYCIGTIECASGTTHNLNAIHILDVNWQHLETEVASREHLHRSAIDHHQSVGILGIEQHIVVWYVVETTDMDIVDTIGFLGNNHTRKEAESLLYSGYTISTHLVTGYDGRRERR